MFFIQQMDQVIKHISSDFINDSRFLLFVLSFCTLAPLCVFESMKNVSYISITAIVSIGLAIAYIIGTSIEQINEPKYGRELKLCDFSRIPYFFGIAMFMFEGNAISIEIYHQMEDGSQRFTKSLSIALLITISLILIVGSLSYSAYGENTQSIVMMNLTPGPFTILVQIFYSVGILCSYCLQIIPTFKIMNIIPAYKNIPDSKDFPGLKSLVTRLTVAFFCCSVAYFMPNLGQFLNF